MSATSFPGSARERTALEAPMLIGESPVTRPSIRSCDFGYNSGGGSNISSARAQENAMLTRRSGMTAASAVGGIMAVLVMAGVGFGVEIIDDPIQIDERATELVQTSNS